MNAPYRAPAPLFVSHGPERIPSESGERRRAIVVPAPERAAAQTRSLRVHRLERCGCLGEGCVACSFAGYEVREAEVSVPLPAGVSDGDTLTVDGAGDTRASDGARGPLVVTIVGKRAAAKAIDGEDRALTKRQEAWVAARVTAHRRRVGQRNVLRALAVLAVVGPLVAAKTYLDRGVLGDPCKTPRDCRSGLCLDPHSSEVFGSSGDGRCTSACRADGDCPGGFACKDIPVLDRLTGLTTAGSRRVCAAR